MRSTRILCALLCCVMLAGCADKNDIQDTNQEPTAASETVTEQVTEEPTEAETEPPAVSDPIEEARLAALEMFKTGGKKEFSCEADGNIVSIYLGDLKFAEIDTGRYALDVYKGDYNFDGCQDLFIRSNEVISNFTSGEYWLCDPETLRFSRCEELDVCYGHGVYLKPENDRLILEYDSFYEYNNYDKCRTTYKWEEGKLVAERLEKDIYDRFDLYARKNEKYTDVFSLDKNGNTVFEERQVFDEESGEFKRTEKDVSYIRVTAEALEYMKGKECIQQIPVEGIPEISACLRFVRGKGEPYLFSNIFSYTDFDFDGYPDLYITTAADDIGTTTEALCYRYDPAQDAYTPITEFNVSHIETVIQNEEEQTVTVTTCERHDKTEYTYTTGYKWVNGSPERISRSEKVEYFDESGELFSSVENFYKYDENGNEYKYKPYMTPVTID